jgi:cell wall-associated NlpC family hydrolase
MSFKLSTTISTALAIASLFGSATVTYAGTSSSKNIIVNRSAYLISKPQLHSQKIVLEKQGSLLKLEPGSTSGWWHVHDSNGHDGYITKNTHWTHLSAATAAAKTPTATTLSTTSTAKSASDNTTTALPPSVQFDPKVHALASRNASYQAKFNAVLKVAKSKLGTPYRWGHNEDRGQYGFDCSNFTAFVYHHALGYKMSGSSQIQYHSVGWSVPIQDMRPGDLIAFNRGGHVGIYIGNGEMIQEGGGLGKVGYLKLSPGSYWYKHISAVKRMF